MGLVTSERPPAVLPTQQLSYQPSCTRPACRQHHSCGAQSVNTTTAAGTTAAEKRCPDSNDAADRGPIPAPSLANNTCRFASKYPSPHPPLACSGWPLHYYPIPSHPPTSATPCPLPHTNHTRHITPQTPRSCCRTLPPGPAGAPSPPAPAPGAPGRAPCAPCLRRCPWGRCMYVEGWVGGGAGGEGGGMGCL